LLAAFALGWDILTFIIMMPLSIAVFLLISEWPKSLAKQKAALAIAHAPCIVTQTCVSLKQMPSLEGALRFVAEHGEGRIARDLKEMLWQTWTGKVKSPYKAIEQVAAKWGRFSRGFQRSVHLIVSSFYEKDVKAKLKTLDKAIEVVLSDITEKMKEYALSLHMPTLILFSLGTIVPLMVISLFPIVSFFGFQINALTITLFLFLSLVFCYIYSTIVLKKRPAALSLPELTDLPAGKSGWFEEKAAPMGLALAIIISIPSFFYILSFLGVALFGPLQVLSSWFGGYGLVWGIGIGVTVWAWLKSSGKKKQRKRVRELEEQFIDGLFHIKNRLSDGRPVESALEFSREILGSLRIAQLFESILKRMRRKSATLEQAIREEKVESNLVNFVFRMLAGSLKEGRKAAAQTASVMYIYLTRIKKVERNMTAMLGKSLSMMKATVLFFAPIVCGIIIVLFQLITTTISKAGEKFSADYGFQGLFTAPAINPVAMQLVVGVYALALNYVLLRYVSRIQFGADDVAFQSELSKAMPITLVIFTATLIASKLTLLR
ncbi:MAG: type II secretion system F family protein, partial [Candidatus Aenigmatarchaeota archaeon]